MLTNTTATVLKMSLKDNEEREKEIILMLTEGERKILKFLARNETDEIYEDELANKLNCSLSEISRSALWLENKALVERLEEKRKVITLSEKGQKYIDLPLPEQRVLDYLQKVRSADISDIINQAKIDSNELSAAIGVLARCGLIRVNKKSRRVEVTEKGKQVDKLPSEEIFRKIVKSEYLEPPEKMDKNLENLIKRGLLRLQDVTRWKIRLTQTGKELIQKGIPDVEVIDKLTPEIIAGKTWREKQLRWYDVTSPVPKIWGGRKHPLKVIIEKIRRVFLEMGFREMRGPWVEIAFWNMDGMWIPQDHPAREMQATFYLSNPKRGYVEDEEIISLVKEVQETGGDTGSLGWQQPGNIDEALKTLLRTHTTAVTFRVLGFAIKRGIIHPPVKFFAIDRVFRNETIDWKHLAEFHQVEGFVVAENLTLRSLMGYIREFYWKMGIKKLRFKPTYNPYTEPSMEIFAWHSDIGKWVEVGNSGLFRPETLRPYGIKVPVIAWGLAVERLAMLLYGIEDIREVLGPMCDVDWLRWYQLPLKEVFR